jgi:hypothetical protein
MNHDLSRRDLLKGLASAAAPFQANTVNRKWTPEASIAIMDKYGTESAIMSMTIAAEYLCTGTEKARGFTRDCNEYGAKLAQTNKRFGFLASIPAREIDASLKEIEYSFDTLKADGLGLFSNTGDKWWGDPVFTPIFDELNRRSAAVERRKNRQNAKRRFL